MIYVTQSEDYSLGKKWVKLMKELLIIGSVVEVNDSKLIIIGSRMMEYEGVMKLHYCVVPYPRGFTTVANVGIIPADAITNVICKGYMSEGGEKYLRGKTLLSQYIDGDSSEDAECKMQTMSEEIKEALELVYKQKNADKNLKGSEA